MIRSSFHLKKSISQNKKIGALPNALINRNYSSGGEAFVAMIFQVALVGGILFKLFR